jgi:bifunctional DNA-binding transcriptional regulator/antitoxin component of YhaV-PrlF toxin-antitoxin module
MITTVTGKNQVTLPARLVKELGLHPGVRIDWSVTADGVLLGRRQRSRTELARELAGRGRKYLVPDSDPIRDLIAERVREDQDEGLT